MKKWHQYWQSWVTIFLALSPIGIPLIWLLAPWSKKAKIIATILVVCITIALFLLYFFLIVSAVNPPQIINQANDLRKKTDLIEIKRYADQFQAENNRWPSNLEELQSYLDLSTFSTDPETAKMYEYKLTTDDSGCELKTTLSSGPYILYCQEN